MSARLSPMLSLAEDSCQSAVSILHWDGPRRIEKGKKAICPIKSSISRLDESLYQPLFSQHSRLRRSDPL
jgi:hypothetical protein